MAFTVIIVACLGLLLLFGRGETFEQRERAIDTLMAIERALMDGRLRGEETLDVELGRARKRVLLGACEVGRFRLVRHLNPSWYVRRRWAIYLPDEMFEVSFPARDPLAVWIDALIESGPAPLTPPYAAAAKGGRMTVLLVLVGSSFLAVIVWLLAFVRPARKSALAAIAPVLKDFSVRLYADSEPEGGRPEIGQLVRLPDQDIVTYCSGDVLIAVIGDRKRRCWWVLLETYAIGPARDDGSRRATRHEAEFAFAAKHEAVACARNLMDWPAAKAAALPPAPLPEPPPSAENAA